MQLHRAIDEQNERRRRNRSLRHVQNAHALIHRNRGALEIDLRQEAVHRSGRNALAALFRHQIERRVEPRNVLAGRCRDEHERSIVQELKLSARLLLEDGRISSRLSIGTRRSDEVPLVDDDNHRASSFVRISSNSRIARSDAFDSVNDDQRNIRGFEMLARHHDRKLLGHQLGLALAADSSSIDEAVVLSVSLHEFVNRVARSPRDRRHDCATSSGQRIEQRGLADIRTTDDGNLGLERPSIFVLTFLAVVSDFLFDRLVQRLYDLLRIGGCRHDFVHVLQQLGHAVPGLGRDWHQVLQPEPTEFLRVRLELRRVHLVDGQNERLAHALQQSSEFKIGRGQFGPAIDNHHDRVGLLER